MLAVDDVSEREIPFADYCVRLQQRLETFYGIIVVTRDIPDPLIGDLDGAEIQIDYATDPEQRCFLLAHLFGHTVQWNVNPRAFDLGRPLPPPVDEALLPDVMEYERQASGYAMSLLHEIGASDVDQWFSDYSACDMAYLFHYYRTGEIKQFRSFWHSNTPLVRAQAIPPFTPTKRVFRRDGIVI